MGGSTATSLSARLGICPVTWSGTPSLSVGTSIPESSLVNNGGASSQPQGFGASAGNTNISLMSNYVPTKDLRFSLSAMTLIPNSAFSQNGLATGPAITVPGANGSSPMTNLMASVSGKATDELTLGVNVTQVINYSGIDNSYGVNGPLTPGYTNAGLGNSVLPDTTVVSLQGGYALTRYFRVSLNVPFGFTSGFLDPTLGLNLTAPLSRGHRESFMVNMGVFATAPFSQQSIQESKITTVTGMISPTYRYYAFSLGLTSQVAYSFYQYPYSGSYASSANGLNGATVPTSASTSSAPDLLRTMNMANMGLRLGKHVQTNTSYSIMFTSREDQTISWNSMLTPLRLTYLAGDFSISGYFFSFIRSSQ